jgi:hypothetical protein
LRERAAPLELVKMVDGYHHAFIDVSCGYRFEHSGFEVPPNSIHPWVGCLAELLIHYFTNELEHPRIVYISTSIFDLHRSFDTI